MDLGQSNDRAGRTGGQGVKLDGSVDGLRYWICEIAAVNLIRDPPRKGGVRPNRKSLVIIPNIIAWWVIQHSACGISASWPS